MMLLCKGIVWRYIFQKNRPLFPERHFNKHILPNLWKITQHTEKFINSHVHRVLLSKYEDSANLNLDAIIVGSDQIWRPKYIKINLKNAYLAFARQWTVKRIAYAASFGTDVWEYTAAQTDLCKNLLAKFDAVSVREFSGVEFCRKYFNRNDVVQLIDPTLLLSKQDYLPLLVRYNQSSPGKMMVYVLDKDVRKQSFISRASKMYGLEAFSTNSNVENGQAPIEERIQPPLEQWLKGFDDAELIITDSYHACIFSIIFRKPFYVIANKERGNDRLRTLLSLVGLENRIIDEDSLVVPQYLDPIDYNLVYEKLSSAKEKSLDFLRGNLL